jgi:hypothetical protein
MQPHPWLRPLWRRVALIAFCAAWTLWEAWLEPGSLWFWLILGITLWGGWDLLLSGKYREARPG